MSSSAGPSRVRRPRRSSALTSNGSTASSTGTDDGARTGPLKVILVSGDSGVMALYLGSARSKRKGLDMRENLSTSRPRELLGRQRSFFAIALPHRLETPGQNALLRVQTVFGLVEHHRLRTVDHLVGDFLAAMRGQAMHEQRVGSCQRHQLGVDLIGLQQIVAMFAVLVAHRHPGVGDDAIGT